MQTWTEDVAERRQQALDAACRRLHGLGHNDARVASKAEAQAGADIVAAHLIARVHTEDARPDLEAVQRLAGRAAVAGKVGCFFSLSGFHDVTIAWADRAGLALFTFDLNGDAEPVARAAADAVARGAAVAGPAFGTGDLADPVEVAALLASGLVGGGLAEVDLWFGGAGQVLTFWIDPGDRETPASVTLGLYPGALGELAPALDDGWQRTHRKVPGGGREVVWVRRCAHANQPPTAVAGDAVLHATAGLAACDVQLERCRVELRPPAELDDAVERDAAAARRTVLGRLGHEDRTSPVVGDSADFARIFATVVERARDHRVAGRAEVEGVSVNGEPAWHFSVRLGGRGRLTPDRWEVEARVPGHLLEPDEPPRWYRPGKVTVGGTAWSMDNGQWRTTVVEDDLEIAAHEAVANVAAAYALAGEALERTAFRSPAAGR